MSIINIINESSNQDELYEILITKYSLLTTNDDNKNHLNFLLIIIKTIPILLKNKENLRKILIVLMNIEENIPKPIYLRKSITSYIKTNYTSVNDNYLNIIHSSLKSLKIKIDLSLFITNNERPEIISKLNKKKINFISNTALINLIQKLI